MKVHVTPGTNASLRSAQIEAWLERFGVDEVRLDTPALASVDHQLSLHNQARTVPHNPDLVERYERAITAGTGLGSG